MTAIELRSARLELPAVDAAGVERPLLVLNGVDLVVPAGGLYLLVGHSGSGKSTLLKILLGLWHEREKKPRLGGFLCVLGENIAEGYPDGLRGRVGAVLQDEGLLDDLSPRHNVRLALRAAGRSEKLALGLLSQAGLVDPPHKVANLSGGMRKRAAVARGLAMQPELFFYDEPTAGLDSDAADSIARLIAESHEQANGRQTTIVITHDLTAFEGHVDGYLVLEGGQLRMQEEAPGSLPEAGAIPKPMKGKPRVEDPALQSVRSVLNAFYWLGETFGKALVRLPPVHPRLVFQEMLRGLLLSVGFVAVAGAVIGGLAVFFALRNSPVAGAFVDEVLVGTGKVLMVVVVPLVTGFFFVARMAAGAAARIGTMQRTNQIAALRMMRIRPSDYLLTPLVWCFSLVLPLVTLCAAVLSAWTAALAGSIVENVSMQRFAHNFFADLESVDLYYVLGKATLSGFLVSVLTYHLAMGPKRSGREVAVAVNRSIVYGMLVVLLTHGAMTLLQFS